MGSTRASLRIRRWKAAALGDGRRIGMPVRRRQRACAVDEHRRERIDGRDGASGLRRASAWERIRWRGVGACPAAAPGLGAPPVHVAGESPSCIEAAVAHTHTSVCRRRARLRSIGLNVSTVRYTGGHPSDKERGGGVRGWNTLRPAGSATDSAGLSESSHFILRCGIELCGAPPLSTACIHPLAARLHRENPRGACVLCRCVCDAMPCHGTCHAMPCHAIPHVACPFRLCVRFGARRNAAKP
jgi:hypothetical protein